MSDGINEPRLRYLVGLIHEYMIISRLQNKVNLSASTLKKIGDLFNALAGATVYDVNNLDIAALISQSHEILEIIQDNFETQLNELEGV